MQRPSLKLVKNLSNNIKERKLKINSREIETLRTKEELVNYFEEMGQSITEEEIEALKKSYEEVQETEGALTLEQLDEVAGGCSFI